MTKVEHISRDLLITLFATFAYECTDEQLSCIGALIMMLIGVTDEDGNLDADFEESEQWTVEKGELKAVAPREERAAAHTIRI